MDKPIHSVIAAYADDGSYGLGEGMPWPGGGLPGDMRGFVNHTNNAPDGRINLLICGGKTYQSLREITFGGKRVLLGVSTTLAKACEMHDGHKYTVPSLEEVDSFIERRSPYRVIWIGGQRIWYHGIKLATEAHLTVARRTCEAEGVARLVWPLHMLAHENGMSLVQREQRSDPKAWATNYEFQVWKK